MKAVIQRVKYAKVDVDGKTVGIGGSATVKALGLYDLLRTHNTVYWHWEQEQDEARLLKPRVAIAVDSFVVTHGGAFQKPFSHPTL